MNPFVANPGPKRKRNRKQKDVTLPVVPQPGTTAAPVAALTPAAIPTPVPAKPTDPAEGQQLEWVLVPKGTTSSSTVAPPPVEPEPEKVSDKLADAQKEVDRLQWIVENSLIILVEPRRAYPLVEFGLLEAYLPAERIEVVAAVTTLTSIFLSGYWFFQKLGLPDKQENRVLGRAHDHTYFNLKGVLSGFTNLNHLSPAEQNRRLAEYETDLQRVVRAFLAMFAGHQTMHRTPAIISRSAHHQPFCTNIFFSVLTLHPDSWWNAKNDSPSSVRYTLCRTKTLSLYLRRCAKTSRNSKDRWSTAPPSSKPWGFICVT